ncbi:MAG: hypothetical protein ABIQ95_11470, partial [Bdellovibrionia bacterium]
TTLTLRTKDVPLILSMCLSFSRPDNVKKSPIHRVDPRCFYVSGTKPPEPLPLFILYKLKIYVLRIED